ncbi:glycoside hydrolase [Polychytrium aggregatum]|uniref:glycoside hydrolase n=1 Tax=Polychytrium aggregatum TaxID=110093 RepID=UPI0022FF037E|nr:glycoside hydrolase [Polychytrium aggregatum]KAI9205353.1 glycoside hydrolase [Polychytrium aggregatum]
MAALIRSLWAMAVLCVVLSLAVHTEAMKDSHRLRLRNKVKEMFYHGYNSYMTYAFPKDELNPIKCNGRGPDNDPNNWNVNDVLGGYSLTLVDTLDTLVIMNDFKGFETAVRKTIEHVHFDLDSRVQVFEVTIRMMGGLLSAHILASDPAFGFRIDWYSGELLALATNLADRLLPAFTESPTGIPFPRVNLQRGVLSYEANETCTAGAGTLVLEMGVLSRLTGNDVYENLARRALDELWKRRTKLNLVGNTIDVQTGEWLETMAGIGAGIDSFYEYIFKAYVLFGEQRYFDIFATAYSAVQQYLPDAGGLFYRNVHMEKGHLLTTWIDSLSAFWPGLQVLVGDVERAKVLHQLYFTIWNKYHGMPERFDYYHRNLAIPSYPLRPELIESTYMLYQATKNPYYLEVGEIILKDIERLARTECGFASLGNLYLKRKEDRMESFFLSETLKYLYLLFDTDNFVNRVDSNFVFTTEGHFLSLPRRLLKNANESSTAQHVCPQVSREPLLSMAPYPLPVNVSQIHKINQAVGIAHLAPPLGGRASKYPWIDDKSSHPAQAPLRIQPESLPSSTPGSPNAPIEIKIVPTGHTGPLLAPAILRIPGGYIADTLKGATVTLVHENGGYIITRIENIDIQSSERLSVPASGVKFIIGDEYENIDPDEELLPAISVSTFTVSDYATEPLVFQATQGWIGPLLEKTLKHVEIYPVLHPEDNTDQGWWEDLDDGCQPLPLAHLVPIQGRVIVLKRGNCSFSEKIYWAEVAGAIGILVVNHEEQLMHMTASASERSALIPESLKNLKAKSERQRTLEQQRLLSFDSGIYSAMVTLETGWALVHSFANHQVTMAHHNQPETVHGLPATLSPVQAAPHSEPHLKTIQFNQQPIHNLDVLYPPRPLPLLKNKPWASRMFGKGKGLLFAGQRLRCFRLCSSRINTSCG